MTPVPHEEWAVRHGRPYREVAAIAADQRLLIAQSTVNPWSGEVESCQSAVTQLN
jgi:hypothetical protein